jgi:hypothetical protein
LVFKRDINLIRFKDPVGVRVCACAGVNNGARLITFKQPCLTTLNQARLIRLNSVERVQENTKKGESGGSNIRSFSDGTLHLGVRITTTPQNHLANIYSSQRNHRVINKLYSLDNHCKQDCKFHYLFIGVIRVHIYCVVDNFLLACSASTNLMRFAPSASSDL